MVDLTDKHLAWAAGFCQINPDADDDGDNGAAVSGVLAPTGVDMFFDLDSSSLTAADKAALDSYAKAVLAANSTAKITIAGYASKDGLPKRNFDLSADRAAAVIAYLVGAGIPAAQFAKPVKGGPTDHFSTDDPRQNRRAVIDPPAPASAAPATPAQPAAPPPSGEKKGELPISKTDPIVVKVPPDADKPHFGVDLSAGYPWSFQATLVRKNFNLKSGIKISDTLSFDLGHEWSVSLTVDPKSGLTAQEMIALINLHWMPPWKKEIEVPLNVFVNEALTSDPGHISGGGQLQVEQHIVDWFSLTLNVTGTAGADSFWSAGGGVLFHIDPKPK
jgi:hypothetical protein